MNSPLHNMLDRDHLLAKLKEQNISELTGCTQSLTMSQILENISAAKRRNKEAGGSISKDLKSISSKSSYRPPRKIRTLSPILVQKSPDDSIKRVARKSLERPHSVASFRVSTPKWDNALSLSYNLSKSLHRVPDRDPTGKKISMIMRELTEVDVVWNPPIDFDRNFPEPTPLLCSPKFRNTLKTHMSRMISRTASDFEDMSAATDRQRKLKAQAGRDLFNLQQASLIIEEPVSPRRSRSPGDRSKSRGGGRSSRGSSVTRPSRPSTRL